MRSNRKGFTLAELLVVVAIIGVLVAVSIPIFTAQSGKARFAADQANVRAAKAAAISKYLTDGEDGAAAYYYDAASGTVKSGPDGIRGYGKSTKEDTGAAGVPVTDGKANLVKVTVHGNADGSYTAEWVQTDGSHTSESTSSGESGSTGEDGKLVISSATAYPSESFQGTLGGIYSYEGKNYVCMNGQEFLAGGSPTGWYENQFAEISASSTVLSSADITTDQWGSTKLSIRRGDLYKDGNTYYIARNDNAWAVAPNASNTKTETHDSGDWVKVNL